MNLALALKTNFLDWRLSRFGKETLHMSLMENVQRRATMLSPARIDLPYEDRLRILNLPSFYYRRARADIIETFKHMTGRYTADASCLKLDNSNMRGHQYKLKKVRMRKSVRQLFFNDRIVNA